MKLYLGTRKLGWMNCNGKRKRHKCKWRWESLQASKGRKNLCQAPALVIQWTQEMAQVSTDACEFAYYCIHNLSTQVVCHMKCSLFKLTFSFPLSPLFRSLGDRRWTQGFTACKFGLLNLRKRQRRNMSVWQQEREREKGQNTTFLSHQIRPSPWYLLPCQLFPFAIAFHTHQQNLCKSFSILGWSEWLIWMSISCNLRNISPHLASDLATSL